MFDSATRYSVLTTLAAAAAATLLLFACEQQSSTEADPPESPNAVRSCGGKCDAPEGEVPMVQVRFNRGWGSPEATGHLNRGSKVRLQYDTERLYDIIDKSGEYGGYFASKFHCYGYGCCEGTFPEVRVSYRFAGHGDFVTKKLDENRGVVVDIAGDASDLEVYFGANGFELRSWYCGDMEGYEGAQAAAHEYDVWDSDFGRNFHLDLSEAQPTPVIRFDDVQSPPALINDELVQGGTVRIDYNTDRMYHAYKWKTDYGRYFASKHHCYGYGCCEMKYPDVTAFSSFDYGNNWTAHKLDERGSVTLQIPADAHFLAVWFESSGYDVKTWYCGGGDYYDRAEWQHEEDKAWDSNYAKNFVFPVQR